MMLKKGDYVGITGCSDGLKPEQWAEVEKLCGILTGMGLTPLCSDYLYTKEAVFSGTGEERAGALMKMYRDERVKIIFDISGGNVANEVLPYLDFTEIADQAKPYFGYSDLTTVINSIYSQTGKISYLYTIQNLIRKDGAIQQERFYRSLFEGADDLFKVSWEFLKGRSMEGIIIGGNIRCLMKLAGTPYMPDFTGKILFLEAYSGDAGLIASLLAQLRGIGVFEKIQGILLGTFSYMEKHSIMPAAPELILHAVNHMDLPVAATRQLGHGSDSRCLVIGQKMKISN